MSFKDKMSNNISTKSITRYSNPRIVKQKLRHYYGDNIKLYLSTRVDKKYMIQNPKGKWIHFGQYGYEDYTKHLDKQRRDNFRMRNHKWKHFPKYTPGHLAYYLLW